MTDHRKPYHDERLAPCPICGGEPWADSKNGTIYCDCGLRYHINGECYPEWHRMDWTADEWNRLANMKAENAKLRELVADMWDWMKRARYDPAVKLLNEMSAIERRVENAGIEVSDDRVHRQGG